MNISFIGGGVMGEAIIKGVLTEGIAKPENIVVSDFIPTRREILNKQYGVKTLADNHEAVKGADIVVIAVKPQDLLKVLAGLKGLSTKQLVLSIVAGATLDTLRQGLAHDYIVRTMPNMPSEPGVRLSGSSQDVRYRSSVRCQRHP